MPEKMDPSVEAWDWSRAAAADSQNEAKRNAAARKRGLLGGAIGLLAAAVLYFIWSPAPAYVVAAIALGLTLLALAAPAAYLKVAGLLDRFGHAVGMTLTWILMTLLYAFLFLPFGLLLRARGRLAITRRPDRRLSSYWRSTEGKPGSVESYRKQF